MLSDEKIKHYNDRVLKLLSWYLNTNADFIEPTIIEELVNECGLTKKEAFTAVLAQVCGLDIENSNEDMEVYQWYFTEMVQELDIGKFRNNAYYKKIKIPEVSIKRWQLKKEQYKPYEAFVRDDLRKMPDGRLIPQIGFFSECFRYPVVLEKQREWMLITPNEIETMQSAIDQSKGKVLTYGLGLGYYAYMVSEKEEVSSVTIVEKDPGVIQLFNQFILPQFSQRDKIKIIEADAFAYTKTQMPEVTYDVIFTDIWHDPSDGIPLYLKMKSYESLSSNSLHLYWIEDTMRCYLGEE